jgi:hypothetical protein
MRRNADVFLFFFNDCGNHYLGAPGSRKRAYSVSGQLVSVYFAAEPIVL